MQITLIVFTTAVVLACILIFHKLGKILLATQQVKDDVTATRRECMALFPQLHALAALEKKLDLPQPLPPMRGWAGSPDFLLTVADAILSRKPGTVVECSSGVSTLVAARCLQLNNSGHVYSLEHDKSYGEKTEKMLQQYGLEEWATILHAPLIPRNGETPWYDDNALPENLEPIEVLVVDGPPYDTAPLARLPALPRMLPRMAKSAVVILDDAAREAEREIVRRWRQLAPDFSVNYLHHEKGCAVLER